MQAVPEAWVRVESLCRIPSGVELVFVVAKGRRGRPVATSRIRCLNVREMLLADLDGGGILLDSSSHPAARQYVASTSRLSWKPQGRTAEALLAVSQAHADVADDWIPLERYAPPNAEGVAKVIWRGPDFLIRAYAKALRRLHLEVSIVASRRTTRQRQQLGVLQFGESFVVAERFEVDSGGAE